MSLPPKKHCLLRLSWRWKKSTPTKKLAAYIFPGRNLSLTVDADPQAEISSKETLAENLTSLTLSNGARVILAKSAGEEQKLQITAVSNKGDLSFPAQQKITYRAGK